jgi:hypothetical protein
VRNYSHDDLDELEMTLQSPGYRLIRERLALVIAAKLRELVRPLAMDKTAQLRGEIDGLEGAIATAHLLRREIREKLKKAPPAKDE